MEEACEKRGKGSSWFVYIVRCADGSLYTGVTTDVSRRCKQHNHETAPRYTRSRCPVRLVFQEAHPDQGSALRREAAIKALSRREKMAVVRQGRRKTAETMRRLRAGRSMPHERGMALRSWQNHTARTRHR
jgi:putative endonuclease